MSEFDEQLKANETELTGDWLVQNGRVKGDITCQRIEWLIKHYLRKVADSSEGGGWETLYQDPNDTRYWERTYPQSEMHGGGPPRLRTLTIDEVKQKYGAQ
jgi:Immunity protein 27